MRTLFHVILAVVMLAGCDSIFGGGNTTVEGTVVDKQTGEPIADIEVTLAIFGGFGPAISKGSTTTDDQGQFRVSTDFDKANTINLFVNADVRGGAGTYNEAYGSYVDAVPKGRTTHRRIEL